MIETYKYVVYTEKLIINWAVITTNNDLILHIIEKKQITYNRFEYIKCK